MQPKHQTAFKKVRAPHTQPAHTNQQTTKSAGRQTNQHTTMHTKNGSYPVLDPVSQAYPEVQGRSPTCYSPVRHSSTPTKKVGAFPFDLHVLSTPPAFVLSQDQTLHKKISEQHPKQAVKSPKPNKRTNHHKPQAQNSKSMLASKKLLQRKNKQSPQPDGVKKRKPKS